MSHADLALAALLILGVIWVGVFIAYSVYFFRTFGQSASRYDIYDPL